jgi:hypothetical protein
MTGITGKKEEKMEENAMRSQNFPPYAAFFRILTKRNEIPRPTRRANKA